MFLFLESLKITECNEPQLLWSTLKEDAAPEMPLIPVSENPK